jgi:hypothetical protein
MRRRQQPMDSHPGQEPEPRKGQRGQAALEFALVLPLLLIVLCLVVDFGVGLTRWIAITNAAREGARLGAVGAEPADIRQKTIDTSDGILEDSGSTIEVGFFDADGNGGIDPGDSVVVDVSYDYNYITPLGRFLGAAIPPLVLSACSDMRVEQSTGQSAGGPQSCN